METTKTSSGGDLQSLKALNRYAVLRFLKTSPNGASVTEVHMATALSRPTISAALEDLTAQSLVIDDIQAVSTSRGGRPGRRYRFNARHGFVAAAVVGLEHIEIAVADLNGSLLARCTVTAARQIKRHIQDGLRTLLRDIDTESAGLRVLTIGVIGVVGPHSEVMPNASVLEISRQGYFDSVGTEFGCIVLIENDANLAAMAEFAALKEPSISDMIGLHADVAIGCGVIINSTLHRGFTGAAGELGFYPAFGWHDSHKPLLEAARTHDTSVAKLFLCAGAGEVWAVREVERFANSISVGIIALVLALNPQLIVIGGAVCAAGDAFFEPVSAAIRKVAPTPPAFQYSELGGDCILFGALSVSSERAALDLANEVLAD